MTCAYTYQDIGLLRTMAQDIGLQLFSDALNFSEEMTYAVLVHRWPVNIYLGYFFVHSIKNFLWGTVRSARSFFGKTLSRHDVAIFREILIILPYRIVTTVPALACGKFAHLVFDVSEEDLFTQIGLGSFMVQQMILRADFIGRTEEFWDLLVKWRYEIGK